MQVSDRVTVSKEQVTSNRYQVTGRKKQPTIIEYIKFSNKFHNASNKYKAVKHA